MSRKYKVLLILSILCLVCGFALIFSYYYFNNKMQSDILNMAKKSIVINTESVEFENQVQGDSDNSYTEYVDALNGEFADIGSDQKIKKVKDYVSVLEIPKYKILAHIYDDVSKTSLAYGVGHYPQTVGLGEKGNCALAGHSSLIYDCILNDIKDINILDTMNVYDKKGKKHIYYVTNKFVVEPTAMYVLDTTDSNRRELTIVTCTNGGKQRLVVSAYELTKEELEEYKKQLNQNKYAVLKSSISDIEEKIDSLNYLYYTKYIDNEKGIVIKSNYSNGCLVRYLAKSKTLKNKHNIYNYEIEDTLLKEIEVNDI